MKRCVIVGGAPIGNYDRLRALILPSDYFIYCDCGLNHRAGLQAEPDLVVGDFDSHKNPELPVETIVLPCEKDDTDTVYAARLAIDRGYTEFLLLGVIGGRLDHTLGNLSILLMLDSLGLKACAADDYSLLEIVSRSSAAVADSFSYFSLLNISGTAEGVEVLNAKYPLHDAAISCEYPYGVSNQVLPGKSAEVSVSRGRLLLVKVF